MPAANPGLDCCHDTGGHSRDCDVIKRAERAEAEVARLRIIETAARELVRANDAALGAFRPRPDIAWRNLMVALRPTSAKPISNVPYVDPFERGAAVAFGLMGMAEAIRERTWNCIMCEGDTDGDTCEWCQAPRGLRCPACEVGPCEDHVRSADDRCPASDKST